MTSAGPWRDIKELEEKGARKAVRTGSLELVVERNYLKAAQRKATNRVVSHSGFSFSAHLDLRAHCGLLDNRRGEQFVTNYNSFPFITESRSVPLTATRSLVDVSWVLNVSVGNC